MSGTITTRVSRHQEEWLPVGLKFTALYSPQLFTTSPEFAPTLRPRLRRLKIYAIDFRLFSSSGDMFIDMGIVIFVFTPRQGDF